MELVKVPALWADIADELEERAFSRLSPAERTHRIEEKKLQQARDAAQSALEAATAEAARYAHDQGIRSRCKGATTMKDKPCKNLYYDMARKGKDGRAPFVDYVVSECWAHEYTDPKTKKKLAPHVCAYSHPNEPTWLPEWTKNRSFRPGEVVNRFAALKRR